MKYIKKYASPIGDLLLISDGEGLCGLYFVGEKYLDKNLKAHEKDLKIFKDTFNWLDLYFKGQEPPFIPKLNLIGSDFRKSVWEILLTIPYGQTTSYKNIAHIIAEKRSMDKMSPQAVGGAVGHNPISIIVPCHRVVGANGNLTGYAAGLDKKIALLKLEGLNMSKFSYPK